MIIEEHIEGEIQYYDKDNECWETYENGILSDANVISCSTKNQCCDTNKFTIGGVFSGSLQLVCKLPGFSRFDLYNARIRIRSWYGNDSDNARGRGVYWAIQVTRVRDIFTIRGMDAMSWTDVLSPEVGEGNPYFTELITVDGSIGATLGSWFLLFFEPMNDIIEDRTGIPNMLDFEVYKPEDNCGIWHSNYFKSYALWTETQDIVYFGLERADDGYKTEKPRDVLRWIAEGIGGFITVDGDGVFQMRQFCQPSLGIAEIYDAETESDSLELADYYVYPKSIYYKYKVTNTDGDVECDSFRRVDPYDEPEFSGFELRVELNAVLDGVFGTFNSVTNGLLYAFARYEDVDVINGENVLIPSGGDQFSHIAKYKAYPVPFRCTVHKPAFYELGQTVVFPDHENTFDNYRYGYAEHVPYIRSVITEIEWTFRGGTKLACGEGESLSMMTLAVESKANSVRRELRSRTEAKEIWAGTSSGFESIEHEPKKLYAVVDEMQQTRSRSSAVSYDSKLYIGDVQIGGDLWSGTTYEYEQLDNYDANRLYLTVDGRGQATTAKLYAGSVQICDSALFSRVTDLETAVATLQSSVTALQAAVTALQNTVVTSAEIRTINVVQDMPGSPISTVLYVVDGGAE